MFEHIIQYPMVCILWYIIYPVWIPAGVLYNTNIWIVPGWLPGMIPMFMAWAPFHFTIHADYFFGHVFSDLQRHQLIIWYWSTLQLVIIIWTASAFIKRVHPSWWSWRMRVLIKLPFVLLAYSYYSDIAAVWVWIAAILQVFIQRRTVLDANQHDYVARSLRSHYGSYRIRDDAPSHAHMPPVLVQQLVTDALRHNGTPLVHVEPLVILICEYTCITNQPLDYYHDDITTSLGLYLWVNIRPPSEAVAAVYPPIKYEHDRSTPTRRTLVPIWFGHLPYIPIRLPVKLHIPHSNSSTHSSYLTLDNESCEHVRGYAQSAWNNLLHLSQWVTTPSSSVSSPPSSLSPESFGLLHQISQTRQSLSSHSATTSNTNTTGVIPLSLVDEASYMAYAFGTLPYAIPKQWAPSSPPSSSSSHVASLAPAYHDYHDQLPIDMTDIADQLPRNTNNSNDGKRGNVDVDRVYNICVVIRTSVWLLSFEGKPQVRVEHRAIQIHRRTCCDHHHNHLSTPDDNHRNMFDDAHYHDDHTRYMNDVQWSRRTLDTHHDIDGDNDHQSKHTNDDHTPHDAMPPDDHDNDTDRSITRGSSMRRRHRIS